MVTSRDWAPPRLSRGKTAYRETQCVGKSVTRLHVCIIHCSIVKVKYGDWKKKTVKDFNFQCAVLRVAQQTRD